MPIMMVATKLKSSMKSLALKAGVKNCLMKTPDVGALSEAIRQLVETPPREN
ncbi:MAG TPA: hypothetical protein VGW76_08795 [Pyrinomonadaceae bacterium]|nr:hypothetical protein [Pyrinomonadaceae bacterium]